MPAGKMQSIQNWQCKRGGFARSGLRATKDIATC
jgi:hypothetical protein